MLLRLGTLLFYANGEIFRERSLQAVTRADERGRLLVASIKTRRWTSWKSKTAAPTYEKSDWTDAIRAHDSALLLFSLEPVS
jgi:hypothetical protein